jgi:hypothetical protein
MDFLGSLPYWRGFILELSPWFLKPKRPDDQAAENPLDTFDFLKLDEITYIEPPTILSLMNVNTSGSWPQPVSPESFLSVRPLCSGS